MLIVIDIGIVIKFGNQQWQFAVVLTIGNSQVRPTRPEPSSRQCLCQRCTVDSARRTLLVWTKFPGAYANTHTR